MPEQPPKVGTFTFAHYSQVPAGFWRWASFSPDEIACRGTGKLLVCTPALDRLQALRDRLGKPLILNSAYRSPEHNATVRGAKASKHLRGEAFDVSMANHHAAEFEAAARAEGFLGFGYYPKQGFMHIDLGPARHWGDPFPPQAGGFAAEPVAVLPPPVMPRLDADRDVEPDPLVELVQRALINKGYHDVGVPDGRFGGKTRDAILSFEANNGLPLTGEATELLAVKILAAPPRPVAQTRAEGEPAANPALKAAKRTGWFGWGVLGTGGIAVLEPIVKAIEGGAGLVARVHAVIAPYLGFLFAYWPLLAIAAGALVLWFSLQGKKSVIADFRSGKLAR